MKRSYQYFDVLKNTAEDHLFELLSISDDDLSRRISEYQFSLRAAGHQNIEGDGININRINSDFELIFIYKGKSTISIGDKQFSCSSGYVVLIPPFTLHSILPLHDDPHKDYWIHFDVYPLYLHNEFIKLLLPDLCHKVSDQQAQELLPLYQMIEVETNRKGPGSVAYINALFQQIIITLMRNNLDQSSHARAAGINEKDIRIVNESIAFIQNNISDPIDIESICNHVHISQSYLYKAFTKILNGSPNYFIQMFRIRAAEQLMKSTNLSIKQISQALSFSSPYYFSNVFKKFYQMSPREYIKNIR